MKKKILFCDLDGTLLNHKKNISTRNRKAIEQMREMGHFFVICTGRPLSSSLEVANQLGLTEQGCYLICYNGGIVYDLYQKCIIKENYLLSEDVITLFHNAQEANLHIQTYDEDSVLAMKHTKELDYYRFHTNMKYKIVHKEQELLESRHPKCLVCCLGNKERLEEFQKQQESWSKERIFSFFSCEEYLEFVPRNVDKGCNIEFLCDLLGVDPKDSYAIGDERNDIPMIQKAHVGIAMSNGQQEVLQAADYITTGDYNHDGVAEIIEKFILN